MAHLPICGIRDFRASLPTDGSSGTYLKDHAIASAVAEPPMTRPPVGRLRKQPVAVTAIVERQSVPTDLRVGKWEFVFDHEPVPFQGCFVGEPARRRAFRLVPRWKIPDHPFFASCIWKVMMTCSAKRGAWMNIPSSRSCAPSAGSADSQFWEVTASASSSHASNFA